MRPSVLDNLVEQSRGAPPRPLALYISLTEACNLKCPSCHVSDERFQPPPDRLDPETVARIVNEAAELGAQYLYLVGGEPMSKPKLFMAAARTAKARGLYTETTTNGTLFSAALAASLVEMGFDEIAFSLDGADASTNDFLRSRAGVYDAILQAIAWLNEAKATSGRERPIIKFNTVLSKYNWRDLPRFVELAGAHGVDRVMVQTLGNLSATAPSMAISGQDQPAVRERAMAAFDRARQLGLDTNLLAIAAPGTLKHAAQWDKYLGGVTAGMEEGFFAAPCFLPFYHIVVDARGLVHPCWNYHNPREENVFDQPLKEIFHGPHYAEARAAFLRKEVPDFCANCCMEHVVTTNVTRVQGLIATGKFDEAIKICDQILTEGGENFQYRHLRFLALEQKHKDGRLSRGEVLREIAALRARSDAALFDPRLFIPLLFPLIKHDAYEEAVELTTWLSGHCGEDATMIWARAVALEKLGRFAEAMEVLRGLDTVAVPLALEASVHGTRASLWCRLGRFADARDEALAALALEPGRFETRTVVAYAYAKLGDDAKAWAEWQKLPPHDLVPVHAFGEILRAHARGETHEPAPGEPVSYGYVGSEKVSFSFVRPEDWPLFTPRRPSTARDAPAAAREGF